MNLNLITKTAMVAVIAAISSGCSSFNDKAQVQPVLYKNITYTADTRVDGYFDDQYDIFKDIFSDFTVERVGKREIKIVIPSDYGFSSGSWAMNRKLRNDISQMAKTLNDYKETSIWVHGHTDSNGNLKYNLGLSQNRADAVKDLLLENKVDSPRVKTIAEAYEMPRCDNTSVIGRNCNRRVELIIRAETL